MKEIKDSQSKEELISRITALNFDIAPSMPGTQNYQKETDAVQESHWLISRLDKITSYFY
jgi:hypothetical protein